MSGKERLVMALILGAAALYYFGWQALYLFALAGLIFLVARSRGR